MKYVAFRVSQQANAAAKKKSKLSFFQVKIAQLPDAVHPLGSLIIQDTFQVSENIQVYFQVSENIQVYFQVSIQILL